MTTFFIENETIEIPEPFDEDVHFDGLSVDLVPDVEINPERDCE